MTKRLLSATASEISKMDAAELKQSIIASEGRIVLAETVVTASPLLDGVSNAEVMASFGADLILINEYDVFTRLVRGMEEIDNPIAEMKRLTGCPIGINLEPVDESAQGLEKLIKLPPGRLATPKTFVEAEKQGVDFICLTGNPATGVTHASIIKALEKIRPHFSGLVFAGKMHGAGLGEKVVSKEQSLRFVAAGADGVLVPTVGTVPGVSEAEISELVVAAHLEGALVMATVGTSQESAEPETIRQFGLSNKRVGVDIHHLGDGSYGRMPDPENLLVLSKTIRGKRHTYYRMALSINR